MNDQPNVAICANAELTAEARTRVAASIVGALEESDAVEYTIRPEVARFALIMERKLRQNDRKKGHWAGCPVNYLLERIPEEYSELLRAVLDGDGDPGDESGDLGNFSMMVADVTGNLPPLPADVNFLRIKEVRRS